MGPSRLFLKTRQKCITSKLFLYLLIGTDIQLWLCCVFFYGLIRLLVGYSCHTTALLLLVEQFYFDFFLLKSTGPTGPLFMNVSDISWCTKNLKCSNFFAENYFVIFCTFCITVNQWKNVIFDEQCICDLKLEDIFLWQRRDKKK